MASQTIDYTRMELGRVLRTYKGRPVCVVARCPKCGRRGERSVTIPEPKDATARGRPYVSVTHVARNLSFRAPEIGLAGFREATDHCMTTITRENVDDTLGAEERRRYDAWVAALRAYVEQF